MLKNPDLKTELEILVENEEWLALKTWFGYADSRDDIVDKILLWGHFFIPEYLRDESPEFHRDLIDRFFTVRNEYTAAPRGFSKTTVIQLCMAFSIANKLDEFIVLIEKTHNEAAEVIKGVHDEFLANARILMVYGRTVGVGEHIMKSQIKNGVREREARGDVFINGVRLRGKGFNSTIRGLKSKAWRPTRIILDDVEEDEHISNPEQRLKYENNYNKGVQPAVDITGSIKVFGTILHVDSLLNRLINNHGGKIYRAHDGDDPATASEASFLWPARWNRERLIAKKQDMMSSGQSSNAYAQEYLNKPIAEEDRKFKYDWLFEDVAKPDRPGEKYQVPRQRITMAEFEKIRQVTTLNGYAMIDPSDATTDSSDFVGCVVIFVTPNGARFRVDVRKEKRDILGVIQLIFTIWEKWVPYGLIKIGVEKKAFNDQYRPLIKMEEEKRQVYPTIEELKPMGRNKENRILGALQGFYETGKMISVGTRDQKGYFIPVGDTMALLGELYDFPGAKNDDLSDAEAYQADIVVVPLDDQNTKTPHRDPVDDPFEAPAATDIGGSHVANFQDPSDIYE